MPRCVPADKWLSCSEPHLPLPKIAALSLCKHFPSVVCAGVKGKTSQGRCHCSCFATEKLRQARAQNCPALEIQLPHISSTTRPAASQIIPYVLKHQTGVHIHCYISHLPPCILSLGTTLAFEISEHFLNS